MKFKKIEQGKINEIEKNIVIFGKKIKHLKRVSKIEKKMIIMFSMMDLQQRTECLEFIT